LKNQKHIILRAKLPLLVFLISCIVDFYGIISHTIIFIYIAKPLLMLSLLWYYFVNAKRINKYFVKGLIFSFLGDVFLMGEGHYYFIAGLVSFLIAHLFYIAMIVKKLDKPAAIKLIKALIPFVIVFVLLLNLLYNHLAEMKIPVIIYAIIICTFGVVSLLLFLQKKTNSVLILVFGVSLFVISDSILAINMFYQAQFYFPLLIMISYVSAQFLICRFVLNYKT